jgi:hypothetical protein
MGMALAGAAAVVAVANTESNFSKCCDWHCGQAGVASARTRASNSWWHWLQAYS